jgi:mono/diheme cytochrome c family protein
MTEVPEHLLRRSRERREALGLVGKSEGGGGPPESRAEDTGGTQAARGPAEVEAAPAPAQPGASAPAEVETPQPEPEPAGTGASTDGRRSGVPIWAMPVLVILPIWGIVYLGAFGDRTVKKALSPREVYAKGGCSSCHGAQGEGGSGPALAGGASRLTFPNEEDHVNWVKTGSGPFAGRSYGNPNRPGGPRPPATGGMPGFEGQLSEAEIQAVVKFEREEL